jgi:peptidoglycan/xylan/chitin deacetylase (PgdA/CDA1 family)
MTSINATAATRLPSLLAITAAVMCTATIRADTGASGSAPKPGVFPNGAVCAVSLTYDDSVAIHHQRVAPLLSAHGLNGTFYLSIHNLSDFNQWRAVAALGHELGNHSLFHPCRREPAENYAWLAEDYDLANYSPKRFRDELDVANKFIDLLDGGRPRTYGNNCTQLTIGRGDTLEPMDPILEKLFVAARGAITSQPVDPANPVFTRLGHYNGDGKTFEQLRAEIEEARARGAWIIYMFHGVGKGTHGLFIDDEEHRKLVEWLDHERASIWTASVVEVAQHLKAAHVK